MPYLTFFNRQIPLYGIFFYSGIFIAAAVAMLICTRKKIPRYEIAYSGVYTMIGALLGAKLLFIAVTFRRIIEDDIPLEAILKGGFVFYGGMIGGAVGLIVYTKQFKMDILPFCDIFAAVLPLGHAFGRIGCHFAGCCYGIPYNGPFAQTYHVTIGQTPTDIPLFPVQLLEACGLVLIFSVLITVYLKIKENNGSIMLIYLFTYPLLRFCIEFLRGDSERGHFLGLSVSQWISLSAVAAALLLLLGRRKKRVNQ